MSAHHCGECHACCEWPSIVELQKPPNKLCHHVRTNPKGCCSIYSNRPPVCQGFACDWLLNTNLGDEHRPDHSGLLMFHTMGWLNIIADYRWHTPSGMAQIVELAKQELAKDPPVQTRLMWGTKIHKPSWRPFWAANAKDYPNTTPITPR